MDNYRIINDRFFTPSKKPIIYYNSKAIKGISLCFEFRYFDKTGKEIYADDKGGIDRRQIGDFHICSYNRKNGYRIVFVKNEFFKMLGLGKIDCVPRPTGFVWYKAEDAPEYGVNGLLPIAVPFEECNELLVNNPDTFDNSHNRPTRIFNCDLHKIEIKI